MGKHKIIKSAAAVALTASVVATAAPGASAASYKTNAKDQLVHTSTGKLVKGWKVFGGKLYKNGKLAPAKKYKIIGTGAAQKLFYGPTLKKGYKTASSKTLLFKDGKLADGWKQAGKGERLYKNGKLDKGYTVYTNVEGDKFLYQNGYLKKGQKTANRGGETLLFVDGKLAKGYVLHEASKTLFNNGKVAEGLVKYPEKDGKFYNDGKLANGEINGAEYKDGVLVAKDIASVKAINGTTVEVTFKEAQKADDVKAADYKIEGLEVKNAAVKQTDSKVVVLTTSAQEAAKEYTLVYKEADTKTFTGVSAVIPTAVKITKGSQQGVIGKEVTVEAQVTVAEGQSKAGIPVTIVVDSNKDTNNGGSNNVASDKKVEVYTDENGVAKYSYTQYASNSEDTVTAYPTGDASVKSVAGKVYWGQEQRLAVSEVTTGNTITNDGKKVYKVVSKELAGKYVFVSFKENNEVSPDKITTGVKVVDTVNTLPTSSAYPYQVTTGGKQYVAFKLDAKGEANFTLQGTEATVTPIVFSDAQFNADYSSNNSNTVVDAGEGTLDATELQAAAPAVTFAKAFTNQLDVTANGEANSAAIKNGTTVNTSTNIKTASNVGGRTYTVVVKDKDGKVAPAGTKAYVTFKKGDVSENKDVYVQGDLNTATKLVVDAATKQTETVAVTVTGNEGKATFKVVGDKDAFVKPTVYLDNGQGTNAVAGKLDDADLQVTGEFTYFVSAVVANATLVSSAAPTNKLLGNETATFTYKSVDQNGNAYETTPFTTTFQVTATNNDVVVTKADDSHAGADLAASTVKAGQTKTFTLPTTTNQTAIKVKSVNSLAADVTVAATATDASLPTKTASVSFTKVTTAVENAVNRINDNKGYVNDADVYNTAAGVTTVNSSNLKEVKEAVEAAYIQNGGDLTPAQIEDAVKKAVASVDAAAAQALVNAATASPDVVKDKVTVTISGSDQLTWTKKVGTAAATPVTVTGTGTATASDDTNKTNASQTVVYTASATVNGQTKTKDFTVTVAALATDSTLKTNAALYTLGAVSAGTATYTIVSPLDVTSLEANNEFATIAVKDSTNNAKTSGIVASGDKVTVTAEDGSTTVYTVQ